MTTKRRSGARRYSIGRCHAGLLLLAAALAHSGAANAGRPLVVDDANVNDKGAGHVESWLARADSTNVLNLAPAYAPIDGLELAAALSRKVNDGPSKGRAEALQAKWRITPSRERGCNVGAVVGLAHMRGARNANYVNGLLTCNAGARGSALFNLGAIRPRGESTARTWGIAFERAFGRMTPHVEWFGEKGVKPTVQVGLRGPIADSLQLDGSIGRSDGMTLTTLGVKWQF